MEKNIKEFSTITISDYNTTSRIIKQNPYSVKPANIGYLISREGSERKVDSSALFKAIVKERKSKVLESILRNK